MGWLVLAAPAVEATQPRQIPIDREWSQLPDPKVAGEVETLRHAARALGDREVLIGGVRFDGKSLARVVARVQSEPLLRALREQLRLPLDLTDFLFYLDDLLVAGVVHDQADPFCLSSNGARNAGILLHPDDVFFDDRPRLYAIEDQSLKEYRPPRFANLRRARDGEPLGPNWRLRYRNPSGQRHKLRALGQKRPNSDFAERVALLLRQLRQQGAYVSLTSTVRDPRRGYLMWGAYTLSRARHESQLEERLARIERANREWDLNIPIR